MKNPQMSTHSEVTILLRRIHSGDLAAEQELIPLVYDELRKIATWHLRKERQDHTLQPTAIVHETYLRLRGYQVDWNDRSHYFAVAGRIMRNILVDYARQSKTKKLSSIAGQYGQYIALRQAETDPDQILAVDQALHRLADEDPRLATIVELRFFVGLSVGEVAEVLGLSDRTVKRDWNTARALLHSQLQQVPED